MRASERRIFLGNLLACTLLVACGAPPSGRKDDPLDLAEALFRYQFAHNASGSQNQVDCYFLDLLGQDAPPALIDRFKGHRPEVLPKSLASVSMDKGVLHKIDGRSGLLFRLEKVEMKGPDHAVVEGGYYEAGLSSSGNTYELRRQAHRWTVVSDKMNWIS